MKRLKELLLLFLVGGAIVFTSGCGKSREEITKNALKNKYGEEFNVYEIESDGPTWNATVSPVNNPDVLFEVSLNADRTISWDDYYHAYVAYLLQEQLRSDLTVYFPKSYIHVSEANIRWEGGEIDFRTLPIEDIISLSSLEGIQTSGCFLDIFLCEEDESEHNFAGEFEYFTKTIDQYIEQKKMIPLNVKMYKVNDETLSKVQEYYTRDLDFDDRFFRDVLGIEQYQGGIYYFDQEELGNPPNIVLQFDKQTEASLSNNFDEYLRRREALENGR